MADNVELMEMDIDPPVEPESPPVTQFVTPVPTPIPQLGPYDLHIEKHPYSNANPETISTSPPINYADNIYWPFKTREDFLQTEVLLDGKASMKQIDRQLAISQQLQGNQGRLTLKTAQELRNTLNRGTIFEDGQVSC